MYRKNTASQFLGFVAINASTGATMTGTTGFAAYRVIDGGAQASATGTVTDKGNGQYSFALSQADTNGNDISILFTMTSMVAVEKTFVTTACDPTTATNFGITSLPTTACTTNASLITSGAGTDQLSVTTGRIDIGKALGTAITLDANNVINVSAKYWAGTAIAATSIPVATAAGAANGLMISGTNAGTTVFGALTVTGATTLTGTVTATNASNDIKGIDVNLIKSQSVTASGGITFPAATLASTTNITAGTIATVTNQLTAAAVAAGVWRDAVAADFQVASSIGKDLFVGGIVPGGAGGHFIAGTNAATTVTTAFTSTFTGNLTGSVNSVTTGIMLSTSQTLAAARALDSIADTALTLNDAFHCAIAAAAGKETVVGTAYTIKTPSTATVLRTFTLDSGSAPTSRI